MELSKEEKEVFLLIYSVEKGLKFLQHLNGNSKKYFSIYLEATIKNFELAKTHAEQSIAVRHLKVYLPKDPNKIEF